MGSLDKIITELSIQNVLNDFIEGQAFSLSNDLAPLFLPHTLPTVSTTGDIHEDWERVTTCNRDKGEGWERRQTIRRQAWSFLNHLILSV